MGDFARPMTTQTSRKVHLCAACGYAIEKGAGYYIPSDFYGGLTYPNKYHEACLPKQPRTMKEATQ